MTKWLFTTLHFSENIQEVIMTDKSWIRFDNENVCHELLVRPSVINFQILSLICCLKLYCFDYFFGFCCHYFFYLFIYLCICLFIRFELYPKYCWYWIWYCPELWCIGPQTSCRSVIGLIMPLYKNKGSQFDQDNYQGIILLSCVGKDFAILINYRHTKYLDAVKLGMNRLDLDMIIMVRNHMFFLFFYYIKAFDFIDRMSLWDKMIAAGLNGKIF